MMDIKNKYVSTNSLNTFQFSGRAYLGGLCDEYDVSVIEDTFAATVATTASHELAHK